MTRTFTTLWRAFYERACWFKLSEIKIAREWSLRGHLRNELDWVLIGRATCPRSRWGNTACESSLEVKRDERRHLARLSPDHHLWPDL
jgi:hypothetical protein